MLLTADERIELIRVKTARAYDHFQDLESRIKTFLDGNPYEVATNPDPQFPNAFTQHYVASIAPMPCMIPLVAGQVLQQLRSALDYLVWDLVKIGCAADPSVTLSTSDKKQIGFPIINTELPKQYESARKAKVKGMKQAAIDAIDETTPYKGGNDLLWKLKMLNDIDKHRFLITAGSAMAYFKAPRFIRRGLARHILEEKGETPPPELDLSALLNFNIIPDKQFRNCPLKEGDELVFGFDHILDKDEEMQFTFEIVFNEPGIVECEPILPLLYQITVCVHDLILSFRPHLNN